MSHAVLITGGTGHIGRRLIAALIGRGHAVTALVRTGSQAKTPSGARAAAGDPLTPSYTEVALGCDTLVHLVGVAHPNPKKAAQFLSIDLASARAAAQVAMEAGVRHIVYLSVAQPAPVMRAYIEARQQGEAAMRATGIPVTILRPWYVLGPGRVWPLILVPLYWLFEMIPPTRATALRLGLVGLSEMTAAIVQAVENPPESVRILDVPAIRAARLS